MSPEQSHPVLQWLQSSGGSYNHECFGLADFQGMGVGGVALQDIEPETTLFTIPNDLILSSSTSSLRPLLTSSQWSTLEGPTKTGWPGLITALMYEDNLGPQSKWYGYLKSLPRRFDTPMFWKEEELLELKGTDIEGKLGKEQAEQDYSTKVLLLLQIPNSPLQPSKDHGESFTIQDYHIQGSRILSRSFTVPHSRAGRLGVVVSGREERDGMEVNEEGEDEEEDSDDEEEEEGEEQVMVPLADMLNAAYERDNARLFHEEGCLKMVSTTKILKGEQIYNTYGSPPNSDLLRKYGHVDIFPLSESILNGLPETARTWPFGNQGDLVDIAGDVVLEVVMGRIGDNVDLDGVRNGLMERVDWWIDEAEEDDTFALGYPPDALPPALIAFARLLNLSESDWEKTKEKGKVPKPKIDFETDGVEVLEILKTVMKMRLGGYRGSLEEDLAALDRHSTESLPLPMYHALVLRTGERRVVLTVLGQLEAMQPTVQKRKAGGKVEDSSRKRQW